jgi:hypothetical protein
MEEEFEELQQAPGGGVPLGVMVAEWFLNFLVFVLTLPLAGVGFACLFVAVGAVAHEPRAALKSIAGAATSLDVFCAMLAALLGARWLAMAIRAPHEDPERARWPLHPLRAIAKPLLIATQAYAVFAWVVWLVVMIGFPGGTSWAWILFWAAVGIAGHVLVRMIDRYPGAK